jgi:hypothetical protein
MGESALPGTGHPRVRDSLQVLRVSGPRLDPSNMVREALPGGIPVFRFDALNS